MKNKIYIILMFVFINACSTIQPVENSNFAEYSNKCSKNLFSDEFCFIKKYITPEGVRITIRQEKNEPFSNSIEVWKNAVINYLEEIGYEILEKNSQKEYEFIKTRVQIKETLYIYGLAFSISPNDPKIINVIEFFGEENLYKKYEKEMMDIINKFYKKK